MDDLDAFLADVRSLHRQQNLRLIGLSASEIAALERRCCMTIPRCLGRVLSEVGLLTNPFRMAARERDWADSRKWLARVPNGEGLVAFEDDGSDDFWALRMDDDDGRAVLFVDHERAEATATGESFLEHLADRWRTERDRLVSGGSREWTVQFSFDGDPSRTLGAFVRALGAEVVLDFGPESKPLDAFISGLGRPAADRDGVPTDHAIVSVDGRRFVAVRRPYGHSPGMSVDVTDPEARVEDGDIEGFRRAIRKASLVCDEVDYGLLPRRH